jgi:hypothetical protein
VISSIKLRVYLKVLMSSANLFRVTGGISEGGGDYL